MANGYVKGVVPADLDPDALNLYVAGEIIIDRAAVDHNGKLTPTLYVAAINPDTRKKELFLVSGAGKYELLEHLTRAHVIGSTTPTNFDRSTLWFNTEMVYVEPSDATKAYISIRTETSPGVWEWRKILPFTSMDTVILGKNANGNPVTLASLIRNNRVINTLPLDVRESSYGELYLNDADELYYKMGPNPADQHLVGTVSTYLRERVIELIKVGNEQPLNFGFNSIWFSDDGDISLARSKYINFVDPNKSTGLKFTRDAQNKMKSGATLENEAKSVVIDNNNTTDYGHIWLNYPVNESGKFYLELVVNDKHNKAQIMFLSNGVQQPLVNDYGTQSDNSQALIDTEKMVFGGNSTNKEFKMHKKTIFIEIEKVSNNTGIKLGYITDSGTQEYIYGDATTPGFSMNLARIAVGSGVSLEANSFTRFSILPYLIKKLPAGYKGINNTLPGENPFSAYVLATNAESVFLAKNIKLADQVEAGRIIPVFRDYSDRNNARINEIIFDSNNSKLYTKQANGRVVPIAGALDDSIEDHILNSLKVTSDDVKTFTKLSSDPRRIYVSKKDSLIKDPNYIIEGNISVVDNSPESDDSTYKMVIPRTLTRLVSHNWLDSKNKPTEGNLKTYLDEIDKLIKNSILTDNVYSGYGELNFKTPDLVNTYNNKQSFIQELSKRMIDNSLYIESVSKKPVGGVSSNQIDNFFSVPEDGILYGYSDTRDNLFTILHTKNDSYINAFTRPGYLGTDWKKIITEKNGIVNLNEVQATGIMNTEKSITSEENIISPKYTINSNTGAIVAKASSITGDTANLVSFEGSSLMGTLIATFGDDKFNGFNIRSKERPMWIDAGGGEHYWLTLADIRNTWNYKGSLFNSGSFVSLDYLTGATSGGYYTLGELTPNSQGFPKANLIGILENFVVPGEPIVQMFIGKDDSGHRIYVRSQRENVWSPWNTLTNEKDLEKKLNLTGGTITGSLEVKNDFTSNTVTALSKIISKKIETPNRKNVISFENDNIVFGDTTLNKFVLSSNSADKFLFFDGTKYQKIILEDDYNTIKNTLLTDYNTKKDIEKLLEAKVSSVKYTEDMKNKVSKTGDTMTGDLLFDTGGITLKRGPLTFEGIAKLGLNGKRFEEILSFNNEPISSFNTTVRYDVVKYSSNNEQAVLTLSVGDNVAVNTSTPSSIQFLLDKDNNLAVNNIINKAVKGNARTVLMKDEIVNDFTGGANKVFSAEKGKELSKATIGKYKGNLFTFTNSSATFNISNLQNLEAGYYYITTSNEIRSLNLDQNIITTNEGILFVEGNDGNRSYRYITKTEASDNFVMAISYSSTGSWKYIYDITKFYSRPEIDDLLSQLRRNIEKMIKSSLYSFTGNPTNNSIPEKLCHTHNHELIGNDDTLYFRTNITANDINDGKNFVIRISGYSMGSALNEVSSPINLLISGRVENQSGTVKLLNANAVNLIPGSSLEVGVIKITNSGYLSYSLKDKVTNKMLSFDTYMRFSSITNTNFDGAILEYKNSEIQ